MSMLPAATSCSSGFQRCVRLGSTSVTAAPAALPYRSPSLVASSRPPAPPPTMTTRGATLALLLQRLHHRREELAVRGEHAAAVEEAVLAVEVGDEAAGFPHEERARRHVPRREA